MQHAMATRALDGGALGLVMPHVDSAAEAREIVDHLKYPLVGHRSVSGAQPQFDYKTIKTAELTASLNAATLTICMVETPKAIANVEAIAAVPGVDVVLVGTNDLAAEMGIQGDFANPKIAAAYKKVIAACKKHKKFPGMGGVYNEELMRKICRHGHAHGSCRGRCRHADASGQPALQLPAGLSLRRTRVLPPGSMLRRNKPSAPTLTFA
jgi:4-hydroxy-2-oxoheptanedioate aldolase